MLCLSVRMEIVIFKGLLLSNNMSLGALVMILIGMKAANKGFKE